MSHLNKSARIIEGSEVQNFDMCIVTYLHYGEKEDGSDTVLAAVIAPLKEDDDFETLLFPLIQADVERRGGVFSSDPDRLSWNIIAIQFAALLNICEFTARKHYHELTRHMSQVNTPHEPHSAA